MNKRSVVLALTVLILLFLTTVAAFAKPSTDTSAEMSSDQAVASCAVDFNATLEWEWTTSDILPEYNQVTMTPAVMDMNGDGSADILFITHLDKDLHQNAHLRVVNGHDGSEIFTISDEQYQLHGGSQLAVGDIDLDGQPEILAISELDELIAFEHDGTFKWRSEVMVEDNPDLSVDQAAPSIADLNQDGTPEIVVGHYAFDNQGNVLWVGEKGRGDHRWGPLSMVLDLDLDGSPEVLAGNSAYRANGDLYWHYNAAADGFTSIGNLDDDPNPEVLLITYGKIRALEHDGTLKWDLVEFPGIGSGGAPVVGDMDGDGQAEIGVANNEYYMLYEADGTLKWKNSITSDKSGVESSSLFDFDGDGAPEILYSDQLNLYIFNGSDGAILWQTQSTSRGGYEYPVVADVDNDGRAEIVMSSNNKVQPAIGGNHGIQVYGHESWPSTREVWNQYSYHINNVNDNGSIPLNEAPSWMDHNTTHLNPSSGCNEPSLCEVDFNPTLEWEWTESSISPSSKQVVMTPAVIDLTDDGIPDVIFITHVDRDVHENGHLRAINGHDGSEIFSVTDSDYDLYGGSNLAVGDIDLDGQPEILAMSELGEVLAFEHDSTFKWRSLAMSGDVRLAAPAIADLDQDGTPEIVIGAIVLNNDGTIRWSGNEGRGDHYQGPLSLVADLDMAGTPEVVAGNTAYNSDGTVYWHNSTLNDGFNAIGNFDEDAFPEIVLVASGKVYLLEHDGTLKWGPSIIPGRGRGGPPTIADVDGDGEPEIGVAGKEKYALFETDGTVKWSQPVQDTSSQTTGASAFDFDGDGSAEILHSDELNLYIYNGSDGTVLWETPSNSRTAYENPVIVDVDADGNAEIVMVTNNGIQPGTTGIQVYGHSTWPGTRGIWNQHSYHITNINDDGTIPQYETPSWTDHNTYRLNLSNDCDDPPPVMCKRADYNAELKWEWRTSSTLPNSKQVMMTPMVMDITGDGISDVVFITHEEKLMYENGHLRAINGSDGSEIFTVTDPAYDLYGTSQVALGDIDNDGQPEILAISESDELLAFEHDGTFKWRSIGIDTDDASKKVLTAAPAIADLDQDGTPEIVVGSHVFNNDGSLRWKGKHSRGDYRDGPLSMVLDLDLDGKPEILAGNTAYRADGTVHWKNYHMVDGINSVGNFDGDPYPEIVFITFAGIRMFEHDGSVKWGPIDPPGEGAGGAPAVADVDGDGQAEIGIANQEYFMVYEGDGTLKWQKAINDGKSGIISASMFDFEGDGAAEIIVSDEDKLYILQGNDGTVLWETDSDSRTVYEYPVIADVDADGHAEIIVASNNFKAPDGKNGIQVYGHESWAGTRGIWNQYSYHISNVNDDGTIPQYESDSWRGHNTYHLNWSDCDDEPPTPPPPPPPPLPKCEDINYNASLEWEWNSSEILPEFDQVTMTPSVMDMNGDGSADILFITHLDKDLHQNAHLRVVNGHDGSEIFTVVDEQYQLHGGSQLAVGDIDLDGKPEILAISELDELIAFEHDGTFKWRSRPMVEDNPDLSVDQAAPSIADLDQDGTPEIVVGHYAFDNQGDVLWVGEKGRGDHRWGPLSMVLDLDLDGSPEVLAGNSAYRANGDLYWHYNAAADGFTSIGNLDDDPNPEIVLITYGKIRALEHDGTLKWNLVEFPGNGSGGAPVVGDVDGDGQAEIGVANNEYYMLYEADGTLKWQVPINDSNSGVASSSLFDFDHDGAPEILFSDHLKLYILKGSDGTVLWETQSTSRGGYEYPVVADVDNDGRAEIVVSSNNKVQPAIGGNHGIQVYGHESWPSTRSVWNQYSYHINNVNDDGSIPQYESNSWQDHNTYHLNPSACWAMCEMVDYQAGLEWQWTDSDTLPDSIQVAMTPVVMDITGDGVPDVLFITHTDKDMHSNGHLRAIDGADGSEIFTITDSSYNVHGGSQLAVGDVDLDGQPEILALSQEDELIAFEHDGTFKWRSSVIDKKVLQAAPAIADIDADGTPEIIVGAHVFNNDGTLRWEGSESRGDQYDGPLSMVVDLDMDGTPELLAGNMAYRSDGTVYWKNNTVVDGFNGLGNFDEDAYPEVLLVTYGKVRMLEHDGTLKWGPIFLPGNGSGGAPAVADVDGDGQAEMAIANKEYLIVLEGDGSIKWQKPFIDKIGVASASMFDFDNDGTAEIIYSGEQTLAILRGSDGSTLWETSSSSRGSYQYPLVVDVDGDGHVEIVMGSNNRVVPGRNGIQVYGHESWPSTRKVWNQYTYHITNVNSDGSIPQHERNSWDVHNTYHLNPTNCGIDLAVTKENDVEFVYQGDTIHYTITVESLSTVDATGVVVSDTLPANTSFVSASDGGTEAGGTVTWNLGEVLADSSTTLNLTIRVNDSVPADGRVLTNRVSVSDDGSNGPDQNLDDNRDDHVDYVDTSEPPICTGTFPNKQIINGDFDGSISVYPADVDGDGDQDILGAGQYADDITWWENDGNGTFTEHTIDADFDGAFSVYADDVDQDGDVDILGAAFGANEVAWWANNGDGTWTKDVIGTSDRGAYSVRTADVDGDGDLDALGAWINNRITWWANNGDATSWTEHVIDADFGGAQAVEVADLDEDGDIDVLGASRYGNDITWWENSGDGSSWTEHLVDGEFRYAVSVEAVDMDRDGDLDLLGSATDDNEITWWENDGSAAGWTEHVVDGDFDGASWATAIDMDYDGDLDVLGAGRDGGEVAWWQNRGGDAILWSKHVVDDQFQGAHSIYAVDLDGNYALDIVAAAYIEDDVAWWRNDCEYAPDLAVTKDDGLSLVRQGQVITYTIEVDNLSVRDGTGVVLTDNLPDHTTFVSASDGGNEVDGVVTWNIGTLSGNSSIIRTVTVQINSPLPLDLEEITNTTEVKDDGANGPDPNPDNNSDTDVDQVEHPGHIKGNLRLVGRDNGDTPYYNGATITLRDSNDVVIATTTSDANGDFELNNVPTGPNTPYTIRAEMELFLHAERNVDVIENQTTTMPFLPLWPGDSNGDGKVDMADLLPLVTLINDGADIYGGIPCANSTSWDAVTEALPKQLDFNGNCIVDIRDIGLHSGTIAAFFSGTNGSVGEDMPVVQTTPGSPAEAGTPWE